MATFDLRVSADVCTYDLQSHNLRVFGFWGIWGVLAQRVAISQQRCKFCGLEVSAYL